MKFRLLGTVLLLAGCAGPSRPQLSAPGPQAAQEELSADLLRRYLTYLASDELEGRCAGFPGNDKATEFIAARFREGGLLPVGDAGPDGRPTYFQHFKFRRGELTTRNCAGLLKGSELPDEIVVLGAHHDHVGRKGQHRAGQLGDSTKEDDIWNGADDNGSGTTALLGVVRHLAATRARPRRSILFMTFSAEEWGLLGSRHYVEHPLFPLDKTVTMINLDMVGRTDAENEVETYGAAMAANGYFRDLLGRAAEKSGLKIIKVDDYFGDGSDHLPFYQKGVLVAGYGEKGPCPDYHRVSDHSEKIDYGTMDRIARASAFALLEIANLPERPKRNPDFKRPQPPEPVSPRLGAYLEAVEGEALGKLQLGKDRGALAVNGVVENGVAAKFGVKEGDILVSIGGEFFALDNPRETLIKALARVIRSEPIQLDVLRAGARKSLTLVWPATEADTKAKELLSKLPDAGDPAIEKEIADLGEAAEARAHRLTGAVGKRVRSGIAVKRRADGLAQAWGTRHYRLRDGEGRETGGLRVTVSRLTEGKVEAIKIDCEQTQNGHALKLEVVCARDSRLSLIRLSRTADGATRTVTADPAQPAPNRTAHLAMMLLAGTLPETFKGVAVHGEEGRPEEPVSLELAGPGEFEQGGKKIKATRVIKRDEGGGQMNVWIDDGGVVLLIQGTVGRVELVSKEELPPAPPK